MLDPITLDQLRTFVAVVDEGSFSAAARKLRRVQSAISHAMANLEGQLGVALWDRSTKIPTLTENGRVLLAAARRVVDGADAFRRVAEGLVSGLEPQISLCVDSIFPVGALVDLCKIFAREFPAVELHVHTETMAEVAQRVLDGTCHLGVAGPLGQAPGLDRVRLGAVLMVPVVAREHPLAALQGEIPTERLAEEVQIVLRERGAARSPDQAVLSRKTWRVVDLHTKHELLRAGLGWGNLPEHMVAEELRRGTLVRLRPMAWGDEESRLPLSLLRRRDAGTGPATRWMIERLRELCEPLSREAAPGR
jgi:DNA-binding transcriptional LysR family regulator